MNHNLSLNMEVLTSPNVDIDVCVNPALESELETGTIMHTIDHRQMTYRDAAEQHPISAITNLTSTLAGKQETLVSGTNIKTINNNSVLGAGNISIDTESAVWGNITGDLADQTDLADVLSTETTERESADAALSSSIVSETNARINADATLGSRITSEEQQRVAADTTISNNLAAEATTRLTQDGILTAKITTEQEQRISADTDIIADLEAHTTNTNNPHSINKGQIGLGNVVNKTMDIAPTQNSTNYVSSGGVYSFVDTYGGKIDHIQKNGSELPITNKTVNISVPTKTSDITNDNNYQSSSQVSASISAHDSANNTHSDIRSSVSQEVINRTNADNALSGRIDSEANTRSAADTQLQTNITNEANTRSSADTNLSNRITAEESTRAAADALRVLYTDVVNNTSTTTTNKPLSANMGKELQDQINNLMARGRFLSVWNSTTGLPNTSPTVLPYTYKTGDYYIIGTVGATNYRPDGTTFTGTASTTVESNTVAVNDMYFFDSNTWTLFHTIQPVVAFETLAGSPYDNTNLSNALNNKVTKNNDITAGTHTKITYDSKGLVTSGSDLTASDIPNLDTSKITSGTFADARIASASTWNNKQDKIDSSHKLNADLISDGSTNKTVTQTEKNTWNSKQPSGNYMTLDTDQTATSKKTLSYTEPIVHGGQETILNVLSTHEDEDMTAMWCGRMKIGNRNKTFLLGVYKGNVSGTRPICGLGAHAWNDSFTEEGAAWEDIYLEPDGDKAVYIGGHDWRPDTGWFKVQNNASDYNGKVYCNRGSITGPDWQEVATLDDIASKENTSNKVITISSASTDTQYPSAKCVYDIVGNIETTLDVIRGVV